VTAASLNHLCPLLEMLESVHRHAPANPVVVVSLDPSPPHIEEHWLTQVHPRVELRRFKYDEHPAHLNVSVHAGQYVAPAPPPLFNCKQRRDSCKHCSLLISLAQALQMHVPDSAHN
jgi:hypothetical protein